MSSSSSAHAPRRDTSRCSQCLATVPPPPAVRDGGAAQAVVAPPAALQPAATIAAPRRFLQCRRCYSVAYCDAARQRAHWPTHKRGCADPTLTSSARSAALFLGTANEGPAIIDLLAYNGFAEDAAQCLDLCKDTRSNPNLWALVDVPRGPERRTRLMAACAYGRLERVRSLLFFLRVDVNQIDDNGSTALHWASVNGSLDVVRELLGRGAIVDARTVEGSTPLSQAAGHGHVPVLHELVARGAGVNARSNDGDTALMLASIAGHAAAVIALECGADVIAQDSVLSMSALMAAAMTGRFAVVRALFAAPGIALDLRSTAGDGEPALTAFGSARLKGHASTATALAAAGAH